MIRSLVIKEISDRIGYLDTIGRFRTEQVKREAGWSGKSSWDDFISSRNQQIATGIYQRVQRLMKEGETRATVKYLRILSRTFPENDQYITDYMRSVGEPVKRSSLTPEGRMEFINRREKAIEDGWDEHNKGRVLMEQGKYREAEDHFKKAMEIDPFETSHRLNYNICLR